MISTIIDYTKRFNTDSKINIDLEGWDYAVVQFVSPSGAITFKTSNDGGAIAQTIANSPTTATNFNNVLGTNLVDGTTAVSASASGSFRFSYIGQYLQLTGSSVTVTKLLVYLSRIS